MAREACWSTENNDLSSARKGLVNFDLLLKITVDHFYAKLPTACDVACANVSVRGQHKDVMHEGPLLTEKNAEKLMPKLALSTNNLTSR